MPEATASDLARFAASDHGHHAHSHSRRSRTARLWKLVRADSQDIRLIVLFAVAVGILNLASPIAVEALVNSVAFGGLLQPIIVLALILCACLTLSAGMIALQYYLAELIQRRLFARSTEALARKLPLVQNAAWESQDPAKTVNRFFEIVTVQKVVSILLLDGISIILTAAIGMIVLAFYHPVLLAFDVGLLLAIVLLLLGGLKRGIATGINESIAKYAVAGWLEEIVRCDGAFQTHSGGRLAHGVAGALTLRYLQARSDHFRVVFRQSIGGWFLQVVAVVMMLGIGGWLVLVGQMTLGQLVAAELIIAVVTGSVAKIGKYLENFYDLMAAVDKLGGFDDLPLDREDGEIPAADPAGATVRIVALSAAASAAKPAAKPIDLTVRPGMSAAIIGGEGAGKSLLAEVLTARRTAVEGTVEIDGVDLRQWQPQVLRERAALVEAGGIVEATILDNVRLGRPQVTAEEVRRALLAVELLDVVGALPDGLETRLTTHGKPLSSGQSRRLLLARALAGRPQLLILDGCLDAIDEDRRRPVWRRIREEYPSTLLLMTANSDLAELCDDICRLEAPDTKSVGDPV